MYVDFFGACQQTLATGDRVSYRKYPALFDDCIAQVAKVGAEKPVGCG